MSHMVMVVGIVVVNSVIIVVLLTTIMETMMMMEIHFNLENLEFDHRKLVLCTISTLAIYYNNYISKEPCMISYNTGIQWLNEILNEHWICCINMFKT